MVLEHSRQRRHVVLESRDGLIDHTGESGIVGCEKGDTDSFLQELCCSFVGTIRRWDLNRLQQVENNGSVRGIERGGDVTGRDQYAVDLINENGAPLRRVDNSDILTSINIRT